jgi:hypothetical protein
MNLISEIDLLWPCDLSLNFLVKENSKFLRYFIACTLLKHPNMKN